MQNLGEIEFHIGVPSLPEREIAFYSSDIFDKWDAYLRRSLNLEDFSLSLEVEDGSIGVKGKIATTLIALYLGIGQYGSFITGIQTIKEQVKDAGEYLSEKARDPYSGKNFTYKVTRRSGTLGQLERLFVSVKKNQLSVEDAMSKAAGILGEEIESAPKFMTDLRKSLESAPRAPEQLDFELVEMDELHQKEKERKPMRDRSPRAPQEAELHNHVKVWRESKKGKKKILVTQI